MGMGLLVAQLGHSYHTILVAGDSDFGNLPTLATVVVIVIIVVKESPNRKTQDVSCFEASLLIKTLQKKKKIKKFSFEHR